MNNSITIDWEGLLKFIHPSVTDLQKFQLPEHPYEKGVFITIQNHKYLSTDIYLQLHKLYYDICCSLFDKNKVINGIRYEGKLPSPTKIYHLVNSKIPIMVCGIHNYNAWNNQLGRGSNKNWGFQHSHFYLYGVHHYIDKDDTKKWENKIKKVLKKNFSNQPKYGRKRVIDIRGVGLGKYSYRENITPSTLYDYLQTPYKYPIKECIINYIAKERNNYPLTYTFMEE